MKYSAKIHDANIAMGTIVNLAIVERIKDDDGNPLSDAIIGAVDCRITRVGTYWSNQTRGESGRWYGVAPLDALPVARAGHQILIGI